MPTLTRNELIGVCTATILTIMTTSSTPQKTSIEPYKDSKLPVEQRVDDLLSRMTLDEKVALCAGKAGDCTKDIPRLGIPSLRVTDGPHGVGWGVKATCFPTAVSMGASWNPDLIRQVGVALAEETRAQNRQVLLGPCINIHRTPLGGRNFESYGEDPYLSGRIAVAYVKGMQSQKVGTSVKHYACNNQEFERTTISVEIDERALREIYLPAFRAAVTEADPWTVMGAYNKVRGKWCCENPHLLNDILKNEWGFKGVAVSDWGATHSVADAANAGLDLEMPGPGDHFNAKLVDAVKKGDVTEAVVDDKARRILRVIFLAGLFDAPDPSLKGAMNTEEHATLARRLAEEAIVLLKNDGNALPLNREKIKSIAVIGPSAETARLGGGGSSNVEGWRPISPLEGLRRKCGDQIRIRYEQGCHLSGLQPLPSEVFVQPDGKTPGLKGEYFSNQNLEGKPALIRVDENIDFQWGDGSPDPAIPGDHFSARWTGRLIAPASGQYEIGITSDDGSRMYLDGKPVIDSWVDQAGITRTSTVTLEAGKSYDIRIEYFENLGAAMVRLGWCPPDRSFGKAIEAAQKSDAAVVFVGLSSQFEGEGYDRTDMNLPGEQDELIEAIAKANKNTIVVLVSGTPVDMRRWIGQVPAVLEAWYPGMEGGNAIANLLFGDVNPSGKLPMTFPMKLEDNPSYGNYPGADGIVRYIEGIFVGYRYYDTKNVEPLFPFGHGLSYTTFEYGDLKIDGKIDNGLKINVSLKITNTGKREGAEVAQLYVRDIESSLVRPVKELKAFKKVSLKPGEKQDITFTLGERDLAFYDPGRGRWIAEPGEFEILVGSGSRDIRLTGKYVFRGE